MAYTKIQKNMRCTQIVNDYVAGKVGARIVEGENKDGYVNMLNKFGTAQDSSEAYAWVSDCRIDPMSLELNYEGNGLFAKIIDTPAREAVKHGFSLSNTDDEVAEAVIKSLDCIGLFEEVEAAIKWSRLFGGGLLVMIIDDGGKLSDPVNYKKVRGVEEVRVFESPIVSWDRSSIYNSDKALFGTPEFFTVSSQCGTFDVHHSRCLMFKNGRLPEYAMDASARFWGTPEYLRIKSFLRESVTSSSFAVKMMERSIQPVYSVKDLANLLQTSDGEDDVVRRLQVIDLCRSLLNTIAIDSDGESYEFKTAPFTGVEEVINSACSMLSAVTNIPQTILFGRAPAGMDATGESDLENYYNYIDQIQQTMLRRNYKRIIDIMLMSMLHRGKIDEIPEYELQFNPLWSLSDDEQATVDQMKAQTALIKAQTAQMYVDMGSLDPSEVRAGLASTGEYNIEELLDSIPTDELFDDISDEDEQNNAKSESDNKTPTSNADEDKHSASAAAVIVLDKDGNVLVGKRGDNGQICGPGGHIEHGEAPIQAAIRETEEEFSITPNELIHLGFMDSVGKDYCPTELYLCNDFSGTPKSDKDEMFNASFMPLSELETNINLFPPFAKSLEYLLKTAQIGQDSEVAKTDDLIYNVDKKRRGAQPGNDNAAKNHSPVVRGPHGSKIKLQHNPDKYPNVTLGKGDGTGEHVVGGFEGKGKRQKHVKNHAEEMGLSESEYFKKAHEFLSKPMSKSMEEIKAEGRPGHFKILRYDYSTNEFGAINSRGNISTYYYPDKGSESWEKMLEEEGKKNEHKKDQRI